MMFACRIAACGALALAASLPATRVSAQSALDSIPVRQARGVNPADNITKFELLPRLTVLDDRGGVSVAYLTLKVDRAFRGVYGLNVEVPIGRYESPAGSDNGVGDLNVRVRGQRRFGRLTGIAGLEAEFPTASATSLGAGKYQLNPTLAGVMSFARTTFTALVAKHFFSVAGDEARSDIVQGQYRLVAAYSSSRGWWLLADPQVWVDYEAGSRAAFQLEGEAGMMTGPTVGTWIRAGGQVGGSWSRQQWTVSGGIRFLRL